MLSIWDRGLQEISSAQSFVAHAEAHWSLRTMGRQRLRSRSLGLGFRRANARLVFRSIAMRLVLGTQLGSLSNLSNPSNPSNLSNLISDGKVIHFIDPLLPICIVAIVA